MKVVYVGPFQEVEIVEAGIVAIHGEEIEVDDDLGKRLLEQAVWERPGAKPDGAKKTRRADAGQGGA